MNRRTRAEFQVGPYNVIGAGDYMIDGKILGSEVVLHQVTTGGPERQATNIPQPVALSHWEARALARALNAAADMAQYG